MTNQLAQFLGTSLNRGSTVFLIPKTNKERFPLEIDKIIQNR